MKVVKEITERWFGIGQLLRYDKHQKEQKMKLEEATKILIAYNEWRRYSGNLDAEDAPQMQNPTEIGVAIDTLIENIQYLRMAANTVKSLNRLLNE